MKFLIFVCAFLLLLVDAGAQTRQTIRIKPGEDAKNLLWKEVYKYPQFTAGKVYAKDGSVSGGKMNMNYLSGTMDFIDAKGDTLALTADESIRFISIGKDTFYYSKGYLEMLQGGNAVRFAVQQKLAYVDAHKVGAMGIPSTTANIESKAVFENDKRFKLGIHEEQVFSKQRFYYIIKDTNDFLSLNKKNVLKLYGKDKASVEQFLAAENIQFDDEKSISKLIRFLHKLYPNVSKPFVVLKACH